MCLVLRLVAKHYAIMFDTGSKPHAASDTGTGAHWAGSGWHTPLTCPMGGFPYRLAGRKCWQEAVKR